MRDKNLRSSPPPFAVTQAASALQMVLRHARKLHLAAKGESLSRAMPALRRIHAAGIFPGLALSALYGRRETLQRKHFLRALAIEGGYPDWETYRPELAKMPLSAVEHFKVAEGGFGTLNAWFSNEEQALASAEKQGGRVFKIGHQAVLVTPVAMLHSPSGQGPV